MILDEIAKATRKRIETAKNRRSLEELKHQLYGKKSMQKDMGQRANAFEESILKMRTVKLGEGHEEVNEEHFKKEHLNKDNLKNENYESFNYENFKKEHFKKEIAFICEIKKASPSKGVISHDFPYRSIAKEYEDAGATAISVLTEPEYFMGSDRYLEEISKEVKIPILRKDFILDEYQIYEAKLLGAGAVLLICSLLPQDKLKEYLNICNHLGLSALVEAHTEKEIDSALESGARIIGVNNRNLDTFQVDIQNCVRLRELVPKEILFVAESGIHTREDMQLLREAGVDAVLIGEALMKSKDRREFLRQLRGSV